MSEHIDFYDPYVNESMAFEFGDAPRYSTQDLEFRLVNQSELYIASNVVLSLTQTDGYDVISPSTDSQMLLSSDGITFTHTLSVGDLSPTEISDIITLRRVTFKSAILGIDSVTINTTIDGWD